ncbi:hypothetical protein MJH12_00500, partial [bacterium]|nr:hypothetical protein [bacterium]
MKNRVLLILLSLVMVECLSAKEVHNFERWQDATDKQPYPTEYKGFKPPTYFMQPKDQVMKSRAYSDYYSLEDHSAYEDPCKPPATTDCNAAGDEYYGRRTDNPLEVYYDKVLNNGASGLPWTKSSGGGETAVSGYQTYTTRLDGGQAKNGAHPMINLEIKNMAPRDAGGNPITSG